MRSPLIKISKFLRCREFIFGIRNIYRVKNIERCWDEIGYFQVGDNPGRKEPGTGEINYRNVFKYIHSRGFDGVIGMEHGNSVKGAKGEKKVIAAYVNSDRF